jgi:hypothetical protein
MKTKDLCNLTELVRSLQRTEGHPDCFRLARSASGTCDKLDCLWRRSCLRKPDEAGKSRPKFDPQAVKGVILEVLWSKPNWRNPKYQGLKVAIVMVQATESKAQAWRRHVKEHPRDRNADIKIFNVAIK